MKNNRMVILLVVTFLAVAGRLGAQNGFSIRAGLLHDTPSGSLFEDMEAGVGYLGSIGFDYFNRVGLELGVMHSTHDYIFTVEAGAIREREAEKNTIFLKFRGIPYRVGKVEFVLAVGPALFDISGSRLREFNSNIYDVEENYSGWGLVTSIDMRYFVSEGISLTFYMSGNFIKYSDYGVNSVEAAYPADTSRKGNSFSWGLTVFHRIGMPKI